MNNGSIELEDSISALSEEIPDIMKNKKVEEEHHEQDEIPEEESNYDELFYGNCFTCYFRTDYY